jgi:aminoglycoside 3-N-acetyltransferase
LQDSFPEQELWFPAFNYDFAKTLVFDQKNDPIQVGALNESLRRSEEYARSFVPIFSILRPITAVRPLFRTKINPFDPQGEFAEIRNRNGAITFFGATIESLTFIHYVENLVGIPYRYEKYFNGQALLNDQMTHVSLFYLVRPLGMHLEYNWVKIHNLLRDAQLVFQNDRFGDYEIYNANALTEFMLAKYEDDIFWTLMENSKEEALLKLNELGRCFKQEDFEAAVSDA